ncbi:hypothetical protein MTP99_013151 [Tenebrio molitor]|nr:hypothetical protein MTP99_013151 [Tenebrio molitor]
MVITNHTNTTEPVRFHWTEYQKNKILVSLFGDTISVVGETPWTKILTSGPVRAIVSAQICLLFNVNTSVNHVPSYMDQVLHFNIKQNGLLSSLPYIGLYSMGVVVARIADKCRNFSNLLQKDLLGTPFLPFDATSHRQILLGLRPSSFHFCFHFVAGCYEYWYQ